MNEVIARLEALEQQAKGQASIAVLGDAVSELAGIVADLLRNAQPVVPPEAPAEQQG